MEPPEVTDFAGSIPIEPSLPVRSTRKGGSIPKIFSRKRRLTSSVPHSSLSSKGCSNKQSKRNLEDKRAMTIQRMKHGEEERRSGIDSAQSSLERDKGIGVNAYVKQGRVIAPFPWFPRWESLRHCLPMAILMLFFTVLYLGAEARLLVVLNAFFLGGCLSKGFYFFNRLLDWTFAQLIHHTTGVVSVFASFFAHIVGYLLLSTYLFSYPMECVFAWQEVFSGLTGRFPTATVNLILVIAMGRWLFKTVQPIMPLHFADRRGRATHQPCQSA